MVPEYFQKRNLEQNADHLMDDPLNDFVYLISHKDSYNFLPNTIR